MNMVVTVVDKLLRSDVLDEQVALQVREKLNRGRSFCEALRLVGVAEERPLRFIAEVLGLAYVELENQTLSKEFLSQFPAKTLLDRLSVLLDRRRSSFGPRCTTMLRAASLWLRPWAIMLGIFRRSMWEMKS